MVEFASTPPPRPASGQESAPGQNSGQGSGQTSGPASVGQLVGKLTENLSHLVRDELQLAQAQIAEKGKALGSGVGAFAGAALFGLFGFGWLLVGGFLALSRVLPPWAAALIVGGVLLLIAGIAALVGKSLMKNAPAPQTKQNIQKDIEALKQGVKS